MPAAEAGKELRPRTAVPRVRRDRTAAVRQLPDPDAAAIAAASRVCWATWDDSIAEFICNPCGDSVLLSHVVVVCRGAIVFDYLEGLI